MQELYRLTITRPALSPADVALVLADHLAAVGAVPQAAARLSEILKPARNDRHLEMDPHINRDPDVDTARLHLDVTRAHALDLLRSLEAAHP